MIEGLDDNRLTILLEYVRHIVEATNMPRRGMKSRWSLKYKRSIDCSRPKGFSQKNYCKRQARGGGYAAE